MSRTRQDIPGIVFPPPLIYAAGIGMGWLLDHWYPRQFLPPTLVLPLGLGISLLGLLVSLSGILRFRRAGTSPNPWVSSSTLVTAGVYRFTRNPMYVGFSVWYIGVGCWLNTPWPLVLLPVVLLVMHYGVILREERYLEAKFGEPYRDYQRRVRRWL